MKSSTGIDNAAGGIKTVSVEMSWNAVSKSNRKSSDPPILLLSSKDLTSRKLSLPFGDKKKCVDIVREELEFSLAFGISSVVWDFIVSPQGNAYAFAAMKTAIDSDSDGKIIDSDITALARTALYCSCMDCLIIDFGASKTIAIGMKNGFISFVKVVMTGGNNIDEAIASAEKVDIKQARNIKEKQGLLNSDTDKAVSEILKTVRTSIESPYKTVVKTGGLAQANGIDAKIKDFFKTDPITFELPNGIDPFTEAVAFGGAIRDKYPAMSVNFGKKETAKQTVPIYYFVALLLPMLLFMLHLNLEAGNLRKEKESCTNAIYAAVTKEFPNKKIVKPLEQVRQEVSKKKQSSAADSAALDILKKISDSVNRTENPSSFVIYEIDMKSVSDINITGEVDEIADAEALKELLSKSFGCNVDNNTKLLPNGKIKFDQKIQRQKKK